MEKYSERQLLMLSNFVYVPASVSTGTISDIIDKYRNEKGEFSPDSVLAAGYGGGMSNTDIADLFTQIDKEIKNDPQFGQLAASRILEQSDIRAVCYTDKEDKNAVVAFRGTGGSKSAWSDDITGLYEEDTRLQKVADDFVHYECAGYDNITVTGHSKGGNMAQYVTVKNPETVARCVSYDGQGFGISFLKSNTNEIKSASPKIKSISGYNDFVNILLFSIAGENVYIDNKSGIAASHSSISILLENEFDENGNFTSFRKEGLIAKGLDSATDALAVFLEGVPLSDKEIVADVGGTTIVSAFNAPSDNTSVNATALATGAVASFCIEKINKSQRLSIGDTYLCVDDTSVCWDDLSGCASMLLGIVGRANNIKNRVIDMKEDINYTIAAKIYAEKIVERAVESIEESAGNIESYSRLISEIASRYRERESAVAALFVS